MIEVAADMRAVRAAFPAVALLSVVVSLATRIIRRGPYYPGWDVLGAAQGLWLVSTKTPGEIVRWYLDHHGDGSLPWNVFGAPVVLLPGWLASLWPWEFWPHAVTLGLTLASFGLVGAALGLRGAEDWGILLLAWGASSALLSWSICGFGFLTGALPHALALWVVLRCRRHLLATLLLAMLTVELSRHVQELGRTVFVVWLAAAFFVRPAAWTTRAIWLVAGTWQLWDAWAHLTFNTAHHTRVVMTDEISGQLLALGARLFVERQIDIPILFVAGMLGLVFVRHQRWFWRSVVLAQVALVVWLALGTATNQGAHTVWPRRFLLVNFLCLASTLALYREHHGRPLARTLLVSLLLVGNGWQLVDTWHWSRRAFDRQARAWDFPLPDTQTTLDYQVPFAPVDLARDVRDQVTRGKRVILLYNLSSQEENLTDPTGVPERLYLALGHARFLDSVLIFGSQSSRWNTFPVRPVGDIEAFLQTKPDPARLVGYLRTHPMDHPRVAAEATVILDALVRRFDLAWKRVDEPGLDPGRTYRFRMRRAARR